MAFGYPKNFFEANEVSKRIAGMVLLGEDHRPIFRILQIVYLILLYITSFAFLVGQYIMTIKSANEISKLASSIGLLLTTHVAHVKFLLLVFRKKRFEDLQKVLEDENYQYATVGESNPGLLLTKGKMVYSILTIIFMVWCWMIGISGNITTVVRLSASLTGNSTFETINMTCNDFISFTFYVPYFTATKWQCIISSTIMYSGMAFEAGVHATHDGLFFGLIYCLRNQLLIVGDVFRTIRQRSLIKLNISEDYFVLHDEDNRALEEELYSQLSHSTEHLKILLRVGEEVEQMFTYVLLIQILTAFLVLASFLYLASTISMTSSTFFLQMEFFLGLLTQLALLCWFGNEITEAGELINSSLYECDWLSCSRRFKKSMILTMIRMQRPILLSLGGFSPLTLSTLVGVCQGSFSYFTLFRNIQ